MTHRAPDNDPGRLLEAARRRLAEALPGSPDEDAAWQAVQDLEAAMGGDGAAGSAQAGHDPDSGD